MPKSISPGLLRRIYEGQRMGDPDVRAFGSSFAVAWDLATRLGEMMRYLCCVYLEQDALKGLSADELAQLNRDSVNHDRNLAKTGHYIASSALQPAHTAKTVRRKSGQAVVTDGPYAESKEVLGGFILIEARDIEEAVRIAENIPVGKFASIEVRPEMKIG